MNILKKASLLIPFILMGMLLLSSHTTNNSIIVDNPILSASDFEIILVADGKRSGGACNDVIKITRNPNTPAPTSMRITIYAAQQMNFQFLREIQVSSYPLQSNSFSYYLSGIYQNLSQNPHNIIFMVEIGTPNNGTVILFDDDKVVYPPFCQ